MRLGPLLSSPRSCAAIVKCTMAIDTKTVACPHRTLPVGRRDCPACGELEFMDKTFTKSPCPAIKTKPQAFRQNDQGAMRSRFGHDPGRPRTKWASTARTFARGIH